MNKLKVIENIRRINGPESDSSNKPEMKRIVHESHRGSICPVESSSDKSPVRKQDNK